MPKAPYRIECVRWNPHARNELAVAASTHNHLLLYDVETQVSVNAAALAYAQSIDRTSHVHYDSGVAVWGSSANASAPSFDDPSAYQTLAEVCTHKGVGDLCYVPGSRHSLVVGAASGELCIWDLRTPQTTALASAKASTNSALRSARTSASRRRMYAAPSQAVAAASRSQQHTPSVVGVVCDPLHAEYLSVARSSGELQLWDIRHSPTEIRTLNVFDLPLALDPDHTPSSAPSATSSASAYDSGSVSPDRMARSDDSGQESGEEDVAIIDVLPSSPAYVPPPPVLSAHQPTLGSLLSPLTQRPLSTLSVHSIARFGAVRCDRTLSGAGSGAGGGGASGPALSRGVCAVQLSDSSVAAIDLIARRVTHVYSPPGMGVHCLFLCLCCSFLPPLFFFSRLSQPHLQSRT